ncbi:MAG TPA: spore coat protein CotJB [Firmicutes bacterium]|nr:spore coat protein CotJB [Bacillota bacterium]
MTDNRTKLLKRIQVCHFAVVDASLYLDTHPNCQPALEYYRKHQKMLRQAQDEYEKLYGPLTRESLPEHASRWEWVDEPWPWELQD